ncbi:MAG: hypothetical protein AAF809_10815 [Bacteroidota bacterium]
MLRSLLSAGLLLLSLSLYAQAPADPPAPPAFDEYVILAEGDTLRGDVNIREPFLRSTRIVVNDSTEYKLDQVSEVNNEDGNFVVGQLTGSRTLLRRVEAGRISLYSKTVMTPGMWTPGPNGTQTFTGGNSSTYEYFRVGGGDVQKASASNLRPVMADHPEALALVNQHQTLTYVQWGLIGAGLALAVVGATQSEFGSGSDQVGPFAEESSADISPLVFVGVGVAVSSWIPQLMRQDLIQQSIETYNR